MNSTSISFLPPPFLLTLMTASLAQELNACAKSNLDPSHPVSFSTPKKTEDWFVKTQTEETEEFWVEQLTA